MKKETFKMIRILLAHPSSLVCDSLRTALDEVEDTYVVGGVRTAEELYFLLPHGNVVLLATELKDATAFDILKEMHKTYPQIKVLILGVDEQPETIMRYVEAGADGYILQDDSTKVMVEKLQAAQGEKAIVSPNVAAAMIERLNELARMETPPAFVEARESRLDDLTEREMEVLRLVDRGFTNKRIASELYIVRGTVKNHVHNILKKLNVDNRREAASILRMDSQSPATTSVD
jgi:DNA-binding NarL/FixJ family response regulator